SAAEAEGAQMHYPYLTQRIGRMSLQAPTEPVGESTHHERAGSRESQETLAGKARALAQAIGNPLARPYLLEGKLVQSRLLDPAQTHRCLESLNWRQPYLHL